jgi:hypothetical protein
MPFHFELDAPPPELAGTSNQTDSSTPGNTTVNAGNTMDNAAGGNTSGNAATDTGNAAGSSTPGSTTTSTGKARTTKGRHKNWGESEKDQLYRDQQKARTTGIRAPVEFED